MTLCSLFCQTSRADETRDPWAAGAIEGFALTPQSTYDNGFKVGGFLNYAWRGPLFLEPNFLFHYVEHDLMYLSVPLLIRAQRNLVDKINVSATLGPEIALKLKSPNESYRALSLAWDFGVGASSSLDENADLFLEIRYALGITDLASSAPALSTLQLLFGVKCAFTVIEDLKI